ncbi:thiamine pyrophosphate-requiring protein [Saccharomonospora xinjiangensis]|uniref:Thiamine pyrophosphate-dependent enzyme, possible carboligase or decarboxylase n=1 Tax=Saccharomonospora xinjiangensis XJ-54 TaxID=882086 RepID=I0UXL2_9PSEU|nr:thiamine pyrophosphate-requiring protein [Saccharomonospora xinjiangensis]EID52615.1 thiamine pyrophosphate-dependent enzyme, possible carboligase or decarboxylase [Saccharomonospora xinjiangensis XJ-54]
MGSDATISPTSSISSSSSTSPAPSGYTTSRAFLEALAEGGVRYVFGNLGSDHPGILEAYAQARADGREHTLPELVICPHESVAMAAAIGYAQVTGVAQAVLVHVECGTQNIGGMLHNAAKGRVGVLMYAGASPYTQDGELFGSRNEFIQWIQDVHDQRGIVRGYTKYDNEIRTGANVKQLVHRALQIASSAPAGPVYLVGPREVMEAEAPTRQADAAHFPPVAPAALAPDVVERVAAALAGASRPVVVTSYLGRDREAVPALVELCEAAGAGVLESVPSHVNFPADHPLHWGYQWNDQNHNPLLEEADVVLVLGSDVPWIPAKNRPGPTARVFVLDEDPLKEQMPLWHVPAELFAMADLGTAVRQLRERVAELADTDAVARRRERAAVEHGRVFAARAAREAPDGETITPEYLVACVREAIDDDTLVLTEAITNYPTVSWHLRRTAPGSLLGSGGGSLGWAIGAAVGAKLAEPERLVVSLVGDGSYLFGVPSSVFWMARRYDAASLTIVFDNNGWNAPKASALGVHPEGTAARRDEFAGHFTPSPDLPGIAEAAGGAWGRTVEAAGELKDALAEALGAVRSGRSAVLAVRVPGM